MTKNSILKQCFDSFLDAALVTSAKNESHCRRETGPGYLHDFFFKTCKTIKNNNTAHPYRINQYNLKRIHTSQNILLN